MVCNTKPLRFNLFAGHINANTKNAFSITERLLQVGLQADRF